jgi:hypothetical protein
MDERFTDKAPTSGPGGILPGIFPVDAHGGHDPHRGRWLGWPGLVAYDGGVLSLLGLPTSFCAPVAAPPGLIGWALARQDRARMRQGLIDPRGQVAREYAGALCLKRTSMALGSLALWGLLWAGAQLMLLPSASGAAGTGSTRHEPS